MSLAGCKAPVKPAFGAALGTGSHVVGTRLASVGRTLLPTRTTKETEMNPSPVRATPPAEPATLVAH